MQPDPHNTDVVANINYFPATGIPIPKSEWKVKYLDDKDEYTRPMLIRDVRKANKTFDLDVNGFTFVTLPQKQRVDRHSSEEDVKREYYPELEEVVKNLYEPLPTSSITDISIQEHGSTGANTPQNQRLNRPRLQPRNPRTHLPLRKGHPRRPRPVARHSLRPPARRLRGLRFRPRRYTD